jgi:hypothetical protein
MGRLTSLTPVAAALTQVGLRLPGWHHRATHTRMDIFFRAYWSYDQRFRFKVVVPKQEPKVLNLD